MNTQTMLRALSDVDETLIAEAAIPAKQNKTLLLRWGAVAACVCLVISGGIFAHFGINVGAHEVLTRSPSDIPYLSANYRSPGSGEVLMHLDLSATVYSGRYDNALFQINIWLTDVSGPVFRQPCCRKEAKRLADCGLEVYTQDVEWTGYWGETVRRTYIVALLTKDQLENFPVDETYGYTLSFADNADLSEYTLVE